MAEIKLLPCPFCGGEAVLNNNEPYRCVSFVKCRECGAESVLVKVSGEYCSDEKAAEKWNRRAK